MGFYAKTSALCRNIAEGAHAHFVPSHRNDHVPHVLKHRVLIGYSLVLILVKAVLISAYVLLPAASVYSSAVTAANVVTLTNAARTALGLPALTVDSRLASAAFEKAEDMVINQYFAHNSPSGLTPWYWIKKHGYTYVYAGENLAVHLFSSEGVHEGWMASPSHRDNIIAAKYKEIGVGVARGTYEGFDTVFVVEMFGTPKDVPVAAPVTTTPPPAPAPEPAPAPTPEPVVEAPPAVTAKVVPAETGYKVTVQDPRVESATAVIGDSSVTLAAMPERPSTFEAIVPVEKEAIEPDGERVYVSARMEDGSQQVETVAVVAPQADVQQVYVPVGEIRPFKLFGFLEIRNLEDSVKRFYVVMSVLLGAALFASVCIKFQIQRHSITLHALAVIGLALTLSLI